MQQAVALSYCAEMAGSAVYGMDQSRISIDTNVGFHTEVPLIAFLAGMHLGVAGLAFVLGRGGRRDQGGVHHAADLEQHNAHQLILTGESMRKRKNSLTKKQSSE